MDYDRSGEGYQTWIAVQKRKALLHLLLCVVQTEDLREIVRNKSDTRVEISQDWLEEAAAGCIMQCTAH